MSFSAVEALDVKKSRPRSRDRIFAIRLMEHLVVPTFVIDPNHKVLIWNRACERLTGIAAAEIVGTDGHWRGFYTTKRACLADIIAGGDWGDFDKSYETLIDHQQSKSGLSAENWCVMPMIGVRRFLAIDAGPIFDEDGELLAVVETLRDITVQHEAQTALKALASIDGLTGIANRRSFDDHLRQEWHRAKREPGPLSVLMLDIDHFKLYNDALGHQRGDECLCAVAQAISGQMLRATDMAARYGGEEFAVILPGTSAQGALVVADRILTAINALGLAHPASLTGNHVTLSIGAGSLEPNAGSAYGDIVTVADAALYRAKERGRNRVET